MGTEVGSSGETPNRSPCPVPRFVLVKTPLPSLRFPLSLASVGTSRVRLPSVGTRLRGEVRLKLGGHSVHGDERVRTSEEAIRSWYRSPLTGRLRLGHHGGGVSGQMTRSQEGVRGTRGPAPRTKGPLTPVRKVDGLRGGDRFSRNLHVKPDKTSSQIGDESLVTVTVTTTSHL